MRATGIGWMVGLALLPGLAGCGDAAGPESVEVYALVEVAGAPLPATIEEAPGFVRTFVSDVIRIHGDGRWDRVQELRYRQPDREEREWTSRSEGTTTPFGGGVVLSYRCNDTASCVAPDRLRFVPGGAVIERPLSPDSVLVWRYALDPGDGI